MKALLVSLPSSTAVITVSPNDSSISVCSVSASLLELLSAVSICADSTAVSDDCYCVEELVCSTVPQAARDTIIPTANSTIDSFLYLLLNEATVLQPLRDLISGRIPVILSSCAGNGKAILHRSARNVGNRGFSIGKAAATMGAERNNGLAR